MRADHQLPRGGGRLHRHHCLSLLLPGILSVATAPSAARVHPRCYTCVRAPACLVRGPVVPVYFAMFALAGVAGSGLAFGELEMPWVLLLIPGVGMCILGVFFISHRRDERIAERVTARSMRHLDTASSMPRESSSSRISAGGGGGGTLGAGGGSTSSLSGRCSSEHGMRHDANSYVPLGGLRGELGGGGGRTSVADMSRGVSCISEACSVRVPPPRPCWNGACREPQLLRLPSRSASS